MATHFNLNSGDIIPQPDFTVTQSQNGGVRASRSYYMLEATWDLSATRSRFARGTAVTTADSTIPSYYNFLTIESVAPTFEPGELVRLTVSYTGVGFAQYDASVEDGGSLEALPTYRLDCRLRDLPFSEHPKWKALTNAEKWLLGQLIDGNAVRSQSNSAQAGIIQDDLTFVPYSHPDTWPDPVTLSADAITFADYIGEGQTTYLAPTFTWTENTEGNVGLNNNQLNLMGKISTPRGNPPEAAGTRDWMLTSASQQQQGELYRTTIEWQLSENGGHDAFLYSDS